MGATVPSDRQGLIKLADGEAFTRVNGTETLVTPRGDILTVNNRTGALRMVAPGAKIEVRNDETGRFERVAQLPGEFG